MTREEYKHILERFHSRPILNKLQIDPLSSEHPDMEYIDEAGRTIGIEVTECWWRDVKLPEMDDYTMSACAKYKSLAESRGERGLWITVSFFDSVNKNLPNMSKQEFMTVICEEIDRHRKYDYVLDDPNISRGDKIALALNSTSSAVLISSIYTAFRSEYIDKLLPGYLYLILSRSDFDRYSRFIDWSELCRVKIPLPPIEEQRSFVNIYTCLEEAKKIASEAREKLKTLCPALVQRAANS